MFSSPRGVAVPQGTWPVTVYVSDTSNSLVRAISPAGWVSTLAGIVSMPGYLDVAPGTMARLNAGAALGLDPVGNRLILADASNNRVRALALDGSSTVSTLAGNGVAASIDGYGAQASHRSPLGAAAGLGGAVLVTDGGSHVVRLITCGAAPSASPGALGSPSPIPLPSPQPQGCSLLATAGTPGTVSGSAGFMEGAGPYATLFSAPAGAAVHWPTGDVILADTNNHRLRRVAAGSTNAGAGAAVTTLAGTGTFGWVDAAAPTAVRFNAPSDVAVTNQLTSTHAACRQT
jgi:hypothetical protein